MAIDLAPEQLRLAQIYQITLSTGTILYFTSYGGIRKELPDVGGNHYTYIRIARSEIKRYTDMQIDIVEIIFPIHSFTTGGKTIVQAVELGWFDDAAVIISQVDPTNVANTQEVFRGKISKGIEFDRGVIKIKITSLLDLLKSEVPKMIYQEQCNHKLFDNYCTLTKADYEETGNADANTTTTRIYDAIFAFSNQAEGYWELGEIEFTSGDNNGIARAIRTHSDGYVDVYTPFDFDISVGDTLKAYPGCNKSDSICDTRYNNIENFFGFTQIPRPEILY